VMTKLRGRVLVVDDERSIRSALRNVLQYEQYAVAEAGTGAEALENLKTDVFDVVLLDIKMPGMDGMEVLRTIKETDPDIPVIMISGHGTIETAVEATKIGAFDFLEKPLDRKRVLLTVRNAVNNRKLSEEKASLEKAVTKGFKIMGESDAIKEILTTVERIGPTQARVLITGENGVGKGIIARAIHKTSDRAGARFVEVCCAAIPDDLIESELLGHEKGAFTGATERKPGKFELADGGTIFLDEIGDMSPKVQAKVLRVIEEGEFERVGGTETISVDVRIIAATNKDLSALIEKGKFREDLFYRLNVVPMHVPPLRRRKEDIPILAEYFLGVYCEMYGLKPKPVDEAVIRRLTEYPWPGNVRELRNTIERMVITSRAERLTLSDLPPLAQGVSIRSSDYADISTYEEFKGVSEKRFFEKKLEENTWNIALTARKLGMQRSNLYKKMQKLGIKPPGKDSDV
jgi:two-component system nitrogen regulation response regulator NtrX